MVSVSGSSPAPIERTTSRSVTMPGPGSSGSRITAAPTLCSVMNAAASRRLRPGVIVKTLSVIASRTFTGDPLRTLESFRTNSLNLTSPGGCHAAFSMRADRFPLGAAATVAALEADPHALHARLRAEEPVSWVPALGGWLVTRRDLALEAMRDAARFTVDAPRFTTAQVVGPSMLSLDGTEHGRHRAPFPEPFRLGEVQRAMAAAVRADAEALLDALQPAGEGELRRGFAGPLAAVTVTRALGLTDADEVLALYDAIVGAVSDLSAGRPVEPAAQAAVDRLGEVIRPALDDDTLLAH